MRSVFGALLCDLAKVDDKVVLLVGDIGYGIFDEFRKKYSDRFFNLGIREQSIISISSGMALQGLKPYVYTISPFLLERAFEQVKLDIDQQNVNVKLVGYGDYPNQGPTHNLILTKNMCDCIFKNIRTYEPKNRDDVIDAVVTSYSRGHPTIILLKRLKNA